jgi:predicted AAA+ superfamily ATPase
MLISRHAEPILRQLRQGYPVIAITGPQQSGKTTLARMVFGDYPYASLEDPDQREFASSDPRGFLALFPDGAVLDEAQRCPALFSYNPYCRRVDS